MTTPPLDGPQKYSPGDIVIPATGMTEETRAQLLHVLGEFDIPAATAGLQTPPPEVSQQDVFGHLYPEVTRWQEVNGPHIRTDRLEPVLPLIDTEPPTPIPGAVPIPMLTLGGIRNALQAVEPHPRSAPIRAGKLHIRIGEAVTDLHDARQYVQEGTAYLGTRPRRPGYRWSEPHWAITPAALYGLTQEDPDIGLGQVARHRVDQILGYLVQPPVEDPIV